MKNIFDKTNLGNLQLKNRLIRSATWEALSDERGHFSEEIYGIYDRLAAGGVGCIISGFTSVADDDYYFGAMERTLNNIYDMAAKIAVSKSNEASALAI